MARSRTRVKPARTPAPARGRWDWRRVSGGLAELLRNIALVAVGTPFVEPLVTGGAINPDNALSGGAYGLVFLVVSLILDHERID